MLTISIPCFIINKNSLSQHGATHLPSHVLSSVSTTITLSHCITPDVPLVLGLIYKLSYRSAWGPLNPHPVGPHKGPRSFPVCPSQPGEAGWLQPGSDVDASLVHR